jgi:hypothetical protein
VVKGLLIAGAVALVLYLVMNRSGGFSLGSGTRLGPTAQQPPYSAGPGTRYTDANSWSFATAVAGDITKLLSGIGGSGSTAKAPTSTSSTTTRNKYGDDLMVPSFI